MKLKEAVSIGRFCGLETVEECVNNITLHSQLFPHATIPKEIKELIDEYKLWLKGELELDFTAIDKENEEQEKKFWKESSNEKIDLDFFDKKE